VFGRELMHRHFLTWEALVQENQRIWETSYLPRPLFERLSGNMGWQKSRFVE